MTMELGNVVDVATTNDDSSLWHNKLLSYESEGDE